MNRFYIYFYLDKRVEALLQAVSNEEGARFYRRRLLEGLGETYIAQGKPDSAIDSLEKAIKLARLVKSSKFMTDLAKGLLAILRG